MTLDWQAIQQKWQKAWEKAELGKAAVKKNQEKFFMIFAYPGISGFLHVGHMRGFSYTDALCRYERLQGKEVLFPVGTHASGNQAIAFANKVKNKDATWLEYLRNNGCPEAKIKELDNPQKVIAYFNEVYVEEYWKKFGFLCDWDRFTCTTFPDYEKFIQWQFKKLQQKNLLVQKPYFATACIEHGPVAVDPSETDISKGGNAEKQEYTLLKFKLAQSDDYLVAATLRPETIYGQTNLWINPDAKYVRVDIKGEHWILSKEAAEKLKHQKEEVLIENDVDTIQLISKKALAPGVEREIIILPATFCDPKVGTGIVTSVPGDAPYDYLALKILQEDAKLGEKYGLDFQEIKNIKLIPIITTQGYGEFPGKEVVEKLSAEKSGALSFDDPELAEANKEVYKAGHHTGVMRPTAGKYAGKSVEEAKELMKAELLAQGKADIFHDLSEEVICRCGNPVVIKRIDDQWFIKYSDAELTERSKEQAREMHVFPKEYQDALPGVLDWFQDRACARLGNWLGSKFPFDSKWTIEPISDSTLYPAYYIVSKFVKSKVLAADDLTEEFFDYVFLGKASEKIEKEKIKKWKAVKEEFDYFYPLDINLGGKEHKTVHFPVFLMNHVAILPEEKWPQGIFVNWWVTGKGSKISKSKGGAEPIPAAIEKYGVDAMRLYYAHIGSPHVDVVWDETIVLNYKQALERIYTLLQETPKEEGKTKRIDEWLLSRVHHHLKSIQGAMKEYNLRDMASFVYFTLYDDLRWYVRRGGRNKKTLQEITDIWVRLMNPITPHLSEELNPHAGKELVSSSSWPEAEEKLTNHKAEAGEEFIKTTMEGVRNILKLAKVETPNTVTLFVSESWLYGLFAFLHKEVKVTRNMGEVMKKVLAKQEFQAKAKEASALVARVLKDPSLLSSLTLSQEEEVQVLQDAQEFLQQEFGGKVKVVIAEESEHPKARSALPGKVGILVE